MNPIDGFLPVCASPLEGEGAADLGIVTLGVGKAAATMGLMEAIARHRPRGILLFGVAGAFPARHLKRRSAVRPGEICLVAEDVFGDEGVETATGFLGLAAIGLGECGPFAADAERTRELAVTLGVTIVRGVTVSTCSGSEEASRRIVARSAADIETMEGAAVGMVCARARLPWVHLRAISNWTGDRHEGAWDLARAVQNVQAVLRRVCRRG